MPDLLGHRYRRSAAIVVDVRFRRHARSIVSSLPAFSFSCARQPIDARSIGMCVHSRLCLDGRRSPPTDANHLSPTSDPIGENSGDDWIVN
jgi:hypothetical protein